MAKVKGHSKKKRERERERRKKGYKCYINFCFKSIHIYYLCIKHLRVESLHHVK